MRTDSHAVRLSDFAHRSMIVLTCVDRALRASDTGSCEAARVALADLAARGVATILTSHHTAEELIAIQQEVGLHEPFIAELGRHLYVPRGYFGKLGDTASDRGEWEVFEFTPPSVEEAIETLMWLFRVSGDSPLLIGVGATWSDRSLLRHVDVPVVISTATAEQQWLCAQFPDAYVTTASGPGGWREAILGSDAPDAAGEPR